MDSSQTISADHQPRTQDSLADTESGAKEEGPPQETPETWGCLGAANVVLKKYGKILFGDNGFFNILAGVFMWIVLAGFLVLPASFPKIENLVNKSGEISKIVASMRNLPLLTLGIGCCVVGATGLLFLVTHRLGKYDWLVAKIFLPGMSSGVSGLISTFVSLYASGHHARYGATTIATLAVTGGCAVICGCLAVICAVLRILEVRHERRNEDKE